MDSLKQALESRDIRVDVAREHAMNWLEYASHSDWLNLTRP